MTAEGFSTACWRMNLPRKAEKVKLGIGLLEAQ